jgi:hypothetical protein
MRNCVAGKIEIKSRIKKRSRRKSGSEWTLAGTP